MLSTGAALLGAPAVAQPAEVRSTLSNAQRQGATRFSVWGFDVYDAGLWVSPGFGADNWQRSPLALELRYLRRFDGVDIASRSLHEMRRAGPISAAQSSEWLHAMQALFPDVNKGDRLVGVYEPGIGVRFFFNGSLRGQLRDAVFAERFFAIWLGAGTSEPAMRAALLTPTDAPAR